METDQIDRAARTCERGDEASSEFIWSERLCKGCACK